MIAHLLPPAPDRTGIIDAVTKLQSAIFTTILLLAAWLGAGAHAAEQLDQTAFIRHTEDADGRPAAMEVAIAQFEAAAGIRVDLVGVVHMAEPDYFKRLDARLAGYDTVLYELVGDPAALAAPRPDTPASLLGLMQGGLTGALGLAFQLEQIDYSRPNMRHADLNRDEFSASMAARGESMLQLLFRAWALGLAQQAQTGAAQANADLLKVLLADNRQLALKRMLARQLSDQAGLLELLSGPEGSTLIEVRNARALEALAQRIDAGDKNIAIFYGAGHMPDFAERLRRDFGMRLIDTEWLEAWDLRG